MRDLVDAPTGFQSLRGNLDPDKATENSRGFRCKVPVPGATDVSITEWDDGEVSLSCYFAHRIDKQWTDWLIGQLDTVITAATPGIPLRTSSSPSELYHDWQGDGWRMRLTSFRYHERYDVLLTVKQIKGN